ncbi:DUF5027 family lipoprotein [Bacillus niameyensis]|uniref:DUF5027 family lipoprotein n=1 Tax=Bacillus niameyensis TaxID=1522308 RepID=UPI000782A84B|nr:hypothetical protein [Bacillus niameyensis]
MNKIKGLAILFFCVLPIFLSACSYKKFEDSLKSKLNKEQEEYINPATIPKNSSEAEEQSLFIVGDTIVFTDVENMTVEYTLNEIHVSDNIHDLGLKADDFSDTSLISNNGDIKKKMHLVTVDVTVKNVDYKSYGPEEDNPVMSIEPSVGFKEGIEDPNGPWVIHASYFSGHAPMDQNHGDDYYYFPLATGEEIDATVGWFVPADQLEDEPLYYIIGSAGGSEDYQYFELKFDQRELP